MPFTPDPFDGTRNRDVKALKIQCQNVAAQSLSGIPNIEPVWIEMVTTATLRRALTGPARAFFATLPPSDRLNLDTMCAALHRRFPETASSDQVRWATKSLFTLKQGNRSMVEYAREAMNIYEALGPSSDMGEHGKQYAQTVQGTVVERFIENIRDVNTRNLIHTVYLMGGVVAFSKVTEAAIRIANERVEDL
ncbi:hypothetical protein SLS56_004281 [Neofusicoccum ribis]|uniref:Retrotransposon gag domain-containing protein n=1 Tax=Neofusicoccum ribis TaxID=45134 RepID=A0ABR3SXN4_9PEZI